jgi:hypothetical protein
MEEYQATFQVLLAKERVVTTGGINMQEKQAGEASSGDNPSLKNGPDRGAPDRSSQGEESDTDFLLPGRVEERKGSLPGNMRVRIVLPKNREFKRVSAGELEATEVAEQPRGNLQRAMYNVKRLLIGVPIPTTMVKTSASRNSRPWRCSRLMPSPRSLSPPKPSSSTWLRLAPVTWA